MNSRIELIHGDCMTFMHKMPDKAFDLAIVDPPFGLKKQSISPGAAISTTGVARTWKYQESKFELWNTMVPDDKYFDALIRITKNQIIWGENNYQRCFGKGRIVWDKNNPVFSNAEIAYQSFTDGIYLFRYNWSGFIHGDNGQKSKETRIHPTQKPVKLYEWLLKNYAKPGDKILDTHLGSGSIAIACHNMGFDLNAYEIDKDYFEAAKKRLKEHQRQLQMFVGE